MPLKMPSSEASERIVRTMRMWSGRLYRSSVISHPDCRARQEQALRSSFSSRQNQSWCAPVRSACTALIAASRTVPTQGIVPPRATRLVQKSTRISAAYSRCKTGGRLLQNSIHCLIKFMQRHIDISLSIFIISKSTGKG